MKKVLAFVLVLAMMLGLCGTALAVTQDELIGVWDMDVDSIVAMMASTEEEMQAMAPLLSLMTGTMEFTAEGTYKMVMSFLGEEDVQEGTYEVTADGKLSMDGSTPGEAVVENDVLTVTENGMTLSFTRSTGEATEASQEDQLAAFLALLATQQTTETGTEPAQEPVAGGKLEVKQENAHFIPGYSNYEYVYAKVENVGGREIKLNDCVLEVYNEAGEVMASKDYGDANAAYLKPGEYTYLSMYVYDNLETEPAKYSLSITEKTEKDTTNVRFPVETDLQLNVEEGWWTRNYMYATITNNTDETVFSMEVVLALLDAEGNILYVDDDSLYDERGIPAGSSFVVRKNIPDDFMEYFAANNLVPASVDAIAFVEVDVEN